MKLTRLLARSHPQTNFKEGKGVVYMSHPTKAVYRYLMSDFVRVSCVNSPSSALVGRARADFPPWLALAGRPAPTTTSLPRPR